MYLENRLLFWEKELQTKRVMQRIFLSPLLFNKYLGMIVEESEKLREASRTGELKDYEDDIIVVTKNEERIGWLLEERKKDWMELDLL